MLAELYGLWAQQNQGLVDDGLMIFPSDYQGPIGSTTYIKFMLVLPESTLLAKPDTLVLQTGQAAYQLYTPYGAGQTAAITLAEQIEEKLAYRLLHPKLQTKAGSLQPMGRDSEDATLSRHDYFLSFSFYGAL